jgi:hypothetical protein
MIPEDDLELGHFLETEDSNQRMLKKELKKSSI